MKKIWILLGCIGLVAFAVYYFTPLATSQDTAADFLPEDVLLVVEQKNLDTLLDGFKVSPLGKAIVGMDIVKIATDLGGDADSVAKLGDLRRDLEAFLASPLFHEFFGQNFALALLPMADIKETPPEKAMASSLICIAKPKRNSEFLQMLGSMFAGKIETETIKHGKHKLQQYHLSSETILTVASSSGYIIAAFDDKAVRLSLDRNDRKEKTLALSPEYMRLHQEFTGADFFSFVATPALHQQFLRLIEGFDAGQKEEMEKALLPLQGWQGMAFGAWQENGGRRDKGLILFDPQKLDPLLAKLLTIPPADNRTIAMMPADIMGYYWSNSVDMRIFWESFAREMGKSGAQIKDLEQGIKNATGLELQEIFSMFGSEAVLVLKDILTTGLVPLPNGAIFLQLEKEKEFMALMQVQLAKNGIPTRSEEYKGATLNILDISLHPNLQPVFVTHKGYLVMATTIGLAKAIVDSDDGQGFVSSAGFEQANQALEQGLTKASNSTSFVEISSVVTMLKEMVKWGGVILALQEPEAARQAKVISDQIVLPLLDGLSGYKEVAARSEMRGDTILLESATVFRGR